MTCIRSLIITSILLLPAISAGSELPESAEQFAKQFHAAHDAGDYSAIENLIYWEGVEQKMKDDTERQIKVNFSRKIKRCYVTRRPSIFSTKDFKLGNKTYGLNLTPIGTFRVEFDSPDNMEAIYNVGRKNDKLFITIAAPRVK